MSFTAVLTETRKHASPSKETKCGLKHGQESGGSKGALSREGSRWMRKGRELKRTWLGSRVCVRLLGEAPVARVSGQV